MKNKYFLFMVLLRNESNLSSCGVNLPFLSLEDEDKQEKVKEEVLNNILTFFGCHVGRKNKFRVKTKHSLSSVSLLNTGKPKEKYIFLKQISSDKKKIYWD